MNGQRITPSRLIATPILISLVLLAGPAAAHDGSGTAGGFLEGFRHPLGGLDHLLAMVAVGIWGAFLGRPLLYILPLLFPTLMAIGGVVGMAGLPIPPVEVGIALSVLVLGAAIALAQRAPVWLACLVVGVFGLFHGYAHGAELPVASDPVAYSAGFVLSTGLLHLAGIAIGLLSHYPVGKVAARLAGGGIAVAGALFLYRAFA